MATAGEELELLSDFGLNVDRLSKGSYYQNLLRKQNSWWCRPGFGQLAQYDSTLAYPAPGNARTGEPLSEYGYSSSLGSFSFVTDFGHVQILTLLKGNSFTGNESYVGEWRDLYSLSIYDVTTDTRWEEVLHRHTSESKGVALDMPDFRGAYQSGSSSNHGIPGNNSASWVTSQVSSSAWFTVFEGLVLFGAEGVGAHVYRPASFTEVRRQQLDGVRANDWHLGYSESAVVSPLSPADGLFSEGYAYLSVDAFPSPSDVAVLGDRVVYISGREVFFSDVLRPQSIMGRNIDFVPTSEELVAVESLQGVLYLFTKTEVWALHPRQEGAIAAGGRLHQIQTDTGALSPRCVLKSRGSIFCLDDQGIYVTTGNLVFSKISDPIDPFFESVLSNPMTNYYQNAGWSNLASSQPRISYSIKESSFAHLCYDPVDSLLFVVFPEQNFAFVNQDDAWVIWNFESISTNTTGPVPVEAKRGIDRPWVVAADRGVFVAGGVERYVPNDVTVVGGDGSALGLNPSSGSYYILMMGRGGGLDRSVAAEEDRRKMNGRYLPFGSHSGAAGYGYFYVHEPVKAPLQYQLPTNPNPKDDVYLFPVSVVNHTPGGVWKASLRLGYDNTEWEPIYVNDTVSLQIDLTFPPERQFSSPGWGTISQSATHQARTWDGAAYARGGDELHFDFSGADGLVDFPAGWTSSPVMNTPTHAECSLFWFPMRKKTANSDVMGMGWKFVRAQLAAEGDPLENVVVYAWQFSEAGLRYSNDEPAQPVDWVMQSAHVEYPGRQHKARGLWLRAMTHGAASSPLFPNWIHGVLNYVLSTDFKGWVSQIVDFTGDIQAVRRFSNKTPIRSRLKDSSGAMKQKVFGSDAKWGGSANSSHGNVLIGDEEWNELQVSDRGRGASSTWMLFGHIRSRAESLALSSVRGLYRVLGNRRRRGR